MVSGTENVLTALAVAIPARKINGFRHFPRGCATGANLIPPLLQMSGNSHGARAQAGIEFNHKIEEGAPHSAGSIVHVSLPPPA